MYCAGRFRHMASTSRFFSQTCLRGSDRAPHKSIRQTRRCAARVVSRAGRGPMIIGIDVAKAELVVASGSSGAVGTHANDDAGVRALVQQLVPLAPDLVVLEATGGYELLCVAALTAAPLPVVVVNPRQVRDFAKATGQLAKTDQMDARMLALFGERVRP